VNGVRLLIRRFVSAVELELEETGGYSAGVTLPSVLQDPFSFPCAIPFHATRSRDGEGQRPCSKMQAD
jgi:hypothetical protein